MDEATKQAARKSNLATGTQAPPAPKTRVIFLALSLQHNLDGEPVITATNDRPIERYSGGFAYHSPNTGETYWVPDAAVTRAAVKIVSE